MRAFPQYVFGTADKVAEEGVGAAGSGTKFRMKLTAYHPGMIGKLADFHKLFIRREVAVHHAGFRQCGAKIIVELVAMSMTLIYPAMAVSPGGICAGNQVAGVIAQAHRASLVEYRLLFRQ